MSLSESAAKALAASVAGCMLGWAGSALTTIGRVDAIERTLSRIESRLDDMVQRTPKTKDSSDETATRKRLRP